MMRAAMCLPFLLIATECAAQEYSREYCVRAAAAHYYSPGDKVSYPQLVDLVHAVMAQEAGCGKLHRNNDGTVDIGCMQINSSHLPTLAKFGISYNALFGNECQNIYVGTWMLHTEIANAGDLWTGVGNYNTGAGKRTEKRVRLNREYQGAVWRKLQMVWASSVASSGN